MSTSSKRAAAAAAAKGKDVSGSSHGEDQAREARLAAAEAAAAQAAQAAAQEIEDGNCLYRAGPQPAYSLHKARCLEYLRTKASHDQLESQGTPNDKAKSA